MSLALPTLGGQVPRRGGAFMRVAGRVVLRLMGWRIEGEMPDLPKFVVAAAPHTSNWDLVVGAAAMFALDLRLTFIGKHTLFRGPFGTFMRWLGGTPVDRTRPHGVVAQCVDEFAGRTQLVLAIAPEGTRRKVERFKSGFLHIARGAQVPVMLATLDYGARCVRLGPTFEPGADVEAERVRTEAFFAPIRGKHLR